MKHIYKIIVFVFAFNTTGLMAQRSLNLRTRSFDKGWSFKRDNILTGVENPDFNASNWRKVDLPHDWSVEDLPSQIADSIVGPFVRSSPGGTFDGFISGGKAWYRNTFKINKADQGKTVYLQFDGIYMNSDVWVNGHHLGNHPYGYTPIYYDLTPYLYAAGKENIIAVQVKNEGKNSRWYPGSGIYRHVWITVVPEVHIPVWGVQISTSKISKSSAQVAITATVRNAAKNDAVFTLQTKLIDKAGKVLGVTKSNSTIKAGDKIDVAQKIELVNPKLWSTENPNLYKAQVTILQNNKQTDAVNTVFGVRDVKIDVQQGLSINGVLTKLKGGCIHHDYGPLGAAAIDRAEERKIELLKANGFNAIRLSHNPPSQEFLNICDRMGMLVINEAFDAWEKTKFEDDYHLYFKEWWNRDLTNMILRDRNHPSIILWSIGNEIRERADSTGLQITEMLKKRVNELDSSRMVTEAVCDFWDARRTFNWEEHTPAIFKILDVSGYNYMLDKYESDHQKYPERIMYGAESYPLKAYENWTLIEKSPYIIGDFVWTAMDYRGEAGCGFSALVPESQTKKRIFLKWPWFNAFCGDLDFIGDKKPQSFYRDVVWRLSKMEMFVHTPIPDGMKEIVNDWGWPDVQKSWTWPGEEGKKINVVVYTRCELVKLELDGKIIAEQKVPQNAITVTFDIPYQAGSLTARGYDNGKEVVSTTLKTAGAPDAIRLKADRSKITNSRNDLSYVSVEIVDASGNLVPNAEDIEVYYTIEGSGEIAGVGNGNPIDVSSFQLPKKKLFHAKGQVIIRPKGNSGKIVLKASAKGLREDSIIIVTQ